MTTVTYPESIKEGYNNRLKGKIYSLLCVYESEGEWEAFLDSLLVELLPSVTENATINAITLYTKLSSLRYLRYEYFRKTAFECMTLISGGKK